MNIFLLSTVLYLLFRWDFEYEKDHERSGFLRRPWIGLFAAIALATFSMRIYGGFYYHNPLVHVGLALILIPDFILQKLFEKI